MKKVLKLSQFWLANIRAANTFSMGLTGTSPHPTVSVLISKTTGKHGEIEGRRGQQTGGRNG